MTGTLTIAVYADRASADAVEKTIAVSEAVGLSVESERMTENTVGENEYTKFRSYRGDDSVRFQFNLSDDRHPGEPVLSVGGLNSTVHEKWARPDIHYQEWMDIVFDLVCRLATQLEADYIAWLNNAKDPMKSVPENRPIGEAIERPPIFGVYTTTVLEDLGGVNSLFEHTPWYVADIDGDRTVVIESEQPWAEGGWRPPTDTIVNQAEFRDDSDQA